MVRPRKWPWVHVGYAMACLLAMDATEVLACDTPVARAALSAAVAAGVDAASWRLAQGPTSDLPVAAIAEQLRCAKRLGGKLPRWAAAGCLVTQRALEQASEIAATAMAEHLAPRGAVLDGTAGLGVDAWAWLALAGR